MNRARTLITIIIGCLFITLGSLLVGQTRSGCKHTTKTKKKEQKKTEWSRTSVGGGGNKNKNNRTESVKKRERDRRRGEKKKRYFSSSRLGVAFVQGSRVWYFTSSSSLLLFFFSFPFLRPPHKASAERDVQYASARDARRKTKIRKGRNKKRRSKITKQDEKGDTKKWREGEALVRPQRIGSKKEQTLLFPFLT